MTQGKPTYRELEKRLAVADPIIDALKHHEVDAVVGQKRLAFLLLNEVREELVSSDAGFRAMFELSGVGMFQADTPAFGFTRVNQKFCEISGYSAEELKTKTYISLTHPEDRSRAMHRLARVIRGKTDSWSAEKRWIRKDGGIIWLGVHGAVLRNDAGSVVKIMAMVSDITARKEAEQELHDRSEKLHHLAADLTRADHLERRRIAQILQGHIQELLLGVKRRKAPLQRADEKTLRQALKDVQNFVGRSHPPPPPPLSRGKSSAEKSKTMTRKDAALKTSRAHGRSI